MIWLDPHLPLWLIVYSFTGALLAGGAAIIHIFVPDDDRYYLRGNRK